MMRASLRSAATVAAATLAVGGVAAGVLPGYWIYLATAVLITAVNLLSLGIVEGRTGMISLCQLSFAGVGAWTVGYLNVAGAPGGLPLWILIGGLAAMPFGIAIGLPALRLRGINLAIVTLGFASAFDAILAANTYPGQTQFLQVPRPDGFDSDEGYFLFVLIVFVADRGRARVARTRTPRLVLARDPPFRARRRRAWHRHSLGQAARLRDQRLRRRRRGRTARRLSRHAGGGQFHACSARFRCSPSPAWPVRNMPKARSSVAYW